MIKSVTSEKGKVTVCYSLAQSSLYRGPYDGHMTFTQEQVSALPLYDPAYHGHCVARQVGEYSWVWFEDVITSANGGIRFKFHVKEMSDDFYDETVEEVFRFQGSPCGGIAIRTDESYTGGYVTPPNENRVWQTPHLNSKDHSDDYLALTLIGSRIHLVALGEDGTYRFVDPTEHQHAIVHVLDAQTLALADAISEFEDLLNSPKVREAE